MFISRILETQLNYNTYYDTRCSCLLAFHVAFTTKKKMDLFLYLFI